MDPKVPLIGHEPAVSLQPVVTQTSSTVDEGTMAPAEVKALESAKPIILGEGLAPNPPQVVKKIQNLEFVDFAELMPNNRDLLHRIDLTDNKASTKAPLRCVTTITSWAQCFMAYSAILLSKFPDKLVEVMAYGK